VPLENALRIQALTFDVDVRALCARVTQPTLVLHAVGDAMCPFEEGRRLAALIPGARFVPLESRNHVLLEHEPAWPRFLEEARAFLASD
jgi:pimeloyl-ACP methyl ester carboxylesterase